jgi:hypothetical protein
MRYQALQPGPKDGYISPSWTKEQLEMVARARRVIGYRGAFPPYEGLKRKILATINFDKAFELRPKFQGHHTNQPCYKSGTMSPEC